MWNWQAEIVAAVTALLTAVGGAADAVIDAIDDPAVVEAVAERGEQIVVSNVVPPDTTPYGLPVADGAAAGWHDTHTAYPATDVFLGCGAPLVSPVYGTVLEVRRVDGYDPAVDNPATRGGRSVSILGFDGVRYYLAHFDTIVDGLAVGDEVALGQVLGTMGDTGRTSACHLHFSISPPCPGKEWSVRRGVVWPYPYLDAWRRGEQLSPADEVAAWVAANPNACAEAMTDPYARDA
jgi:murein DD-endopeptidase MepM/ murein hydrolase activator NlpD